MKVILNYLETCKEIQKLIDEMNNNLSDITQPILKDRNVMQAIHRSMQNYLSEESDKGIAMRIELFILLYLYAPIVLVGGKKPHNGILLDIAKTLGISDCNLTRYKKTTYDFYKTYKPFKRKVDDVFSKVCAEFSVNV